MSAAADAMLPAAQNLLLACDHALNDLLKDELAQLAALTYSITDKALTELSTRQEMRA